MKLRYLLVTLLLLGALLLGTARLAVEVSKTMERPIVLPVAVQQLPALPEEAPRADTVAVADTLAAAEAALPDSTAQLSPELDTVAQAVAPSVPQPQPALEEVYNARKLDEAVRKHAAAAVSEWGEAVSGSVASVRLPAADRQRVLFLTLNTYHRDYPAFFEFLQAQQIKSTVFLSGRWVRRHAARAKEIGAMNNLYAIGNHGENARPLSAKGDSIYGITGTASLAAAVAEVREGARSIHAATGSTPRYVRPYVNYTDNVVVAALAETGVKTIGYSLLGDGGGLYSAERIKSELLEAPHGAIILLSINPDYPNILEGLKAAVEEIAAKSLPVRFEWLAAESEPYFVYRQ